MLVEHTMTRRQGYGSQRMKGRGRRMSRSIGNVTPRYTQWPSWIEWFAFFRLSCTPLLLVFPVFPVFPSLQVSSMFVRGRRLRERFIGNRNRSQNFRLLVSTSFIKRQNGAARVAVEASASFGTLRKIVRIRRVGGTLAPIGCHARPSTLLHLLSKDKSVDSTLLQRRSNTPLKRHLRRGEA